MSLPVPEMTYNVFSGTLNPTHFTSLHHVTTEEAKLITVTQKTQQPLWQCLTLNDIELRHKHNNL